MRVATLVGLFTAGVITTAAGNASQTDWPFPQDTPTVEPVSIGMASDRPIDISRFLLARGASASSINAQGSHVAYISSVTGRRQLWVMPARGGQAKQLTYGNGITFYRWHPDGQRLLYAADNNGDEREAYYLISMDGTREQQVLPYSNGYREFGAFSQDGNRFSYASTERNGRDFDIYVFDIQSGKTSMVFEAEYGFSPAAWHPDNQRLLLTETRGEDANNLYLLDTQSGNVSTLFIPEVAASYENLIWHPDGEGFHFTSNQNGEMKHWQFYSLTNGQHQDLATPQHNVERLRLCNAGQSMLWQVNQDGYSQLFVRSLSNNRDKVIKLPVGVYSSSCAKSGDMAIVQVSGPQGPGRLFSLNLSTGSVTQIFDADMAGIQSEELVTPEIISFPARDGVTLHGLLYMPAQSSDAPLPPLVVDIHGGPTAQARPSWQPLTQYLVGKGVAVLDINVRGSTGYGKTFSRLDNQEKRLDSVRDLVDALRWLEKEGRVDTSRAAAIGGSYGGYMVNAVMGAYPDAFKAGASFVGVADWVRALNNASPGLKASDRIEYGDISEARWQRFYANNSPINTVNNITAPMFFQHGVNDPRDPVTESDTMVKALRERGIPVTYLRFPDEGHSVRKLENRVTFYRQLAEFLEQHL
ncbi:S9 family peptidase [Aestuariibacter salexigens]|uniref:S9 family peptidase n=1 Tax=Aestuariibacter salexigens TaxID=226010 RepID=UPI000421AF8A|nr:S9 family peptidase [Aestuariibacter salexigens]